MNKSPLKKSKSVGNYPLPPPYIATGIFTQTKLSKRHKHQINNHRFFGENVSSHHYDSGK